MKRFGSVWMLAALVGTGAFGAGYERTILWSGKQAGVAGAGIATASGSENLYFNPAGLAGIQHLEATANFSPTWVQPKGPIFAPNQQLEGANSFLPVFGVTAGYKLTDKLGVGAGAYVGGGSRAAFENIDLSSFTVPFSMKPNLVSQVTMLEYALGVGYELLPGLKIGAAWRIMHVTGKVQTFAIRSLGGGNTALVETTLDNLSDTRFNGFRFGARYDAEDWGVAATVRTAVAFTLKGSSSGRIQLNAGGTNAPEAAATGTDATIHNTFPVEGALGVYKDFADHTWRVMAEYQYANYGTNRELALTGTVTFPTIGAVNLAGQNITQAWRDLHEGHLGVEYRGFQDTVLRAGYAIAGDSTGKGWARPTFSPPGTGHSIAVGAGRSYLDKKLDVDLAVEYSFTNASVAAADVAPGSTTQPGDYRGTAYSAQLGATYRF